MLDQDAPEGDKPGPFFQVDDVDAFYAGHQGELAFVAPPKDIPPAATSPSTTRGATGCTCST